VTLAEQGDQPWLREPAAQAARELLQQTLLFPLARALASPRVQGAELLSAAPQPALLAANHASDIDTPLILQALPRTFRRRTLVAAAADRFYRDRMRATLTALWFNTFPFDRGASLRGLQSAALLLREGYNVLLYPQATRSAGSLEGFRTGVARLAIATSTPLIPVYVGGSALVMPKGRGVIQRGQVTVAFGRALLPADGEQPQQLLARLQQSVAALRAGTARRRRGR
jgi:1-acyl-sn-glycerol-3-phosphate acyltransferase